jgi:transcription elongation factor Elf1
MGRRKRRKLLRPVRKTLPKIYTCPNCGMVSVRVVGKEKKTNNVETFEYKVVCGSCNKKLEKTSETKIEAIDLYNEFVDKVMKGEI